ncbi:GNAT family N-acetyltransferase [Erwinia sp. OLTSP20]|uniref:GNAT family N-acetyltransferase n=1 Tax=unclassified Erwinia TaxID=2622719 RepID=UPI000C19BF71|nr:MULTISPECIES: GNAT family N-acetyltransferase [unclassified Erwinia]PIJ48695.1 GNAT family N-acetyltransferase [Erwinia sp. OAMSP11]PIJ69319.1 GNAT family N-acetyltransferase [Erwinia sp. OLSSP12]PIJ79153.1 GNAT family N-acetyltransferase [Erwinia sp. OLCASP19]PIJ80679.1 GNAT family N-acetyltransferase [Erwinia sp. OLMTSP26]PIJ82829.1 GNAT family N-acetyltransferase [Erwinia sp. OLMDSP33]
MINYIWLNGEQAQQQLDALSRVLTACVAGGASVGFTDATDSMTIRRFWQSASMAVAQGEKALAVARQNGEIVATLMVVLAMPVNGRHRAEICKLLVHPDARRQGIARALMVMAESYARKAGRTLLVLDTRSDDFAQALYLSLGWQVAGQIPGYACSTQGVLEATTVMYKRLDKA